MLEICPTSNLLTKALPDEDEVRDTFRAFVDRGVRVHDRDGRPGDDAHPPPRRVRLLLRIGALDEDELGEANARGHEASFVRASAVAA